MEELKAEKEETGAGDTGSVPQPEPLKKEPETQTGKRRDERHKKKEDKSVEQVLKTLGSLGTTDEKLAVLCKKYSDIVDENKKLQLQIKQYEKKVIGLNREKDQLELEQGKIVLSRSRLESLCRELQKQNKQIKEESLNRIKEEEERRKNVSEKFQLTLGEITHLMQQNNDNNSKLRDENLEIQSKFKEVCEKYELREQQIEKMSQQMKLESQLAEAQLTKLKIEMLADKEMLVNEKQQLLLELAAYKEKCQELQKVEAALKFQIQTYTEKYDKFQGALAKSNELYGSFKSEIEKMSKKIVKLEKETSVWKSRWENNHKVLLQVAAEKQQKVEELSLATRQVNQLQKLCRVLQADRTSLLAQLKSEGITPKLSGECNESEPQEEVKLQTPEEIPNQVVLESQEIKSETPEEVPNPVVVENGNDEGTSLENENPEMLESNETAPHVTEPPEPEMSENEQQKEVNKEEGKVKTKKGKVINDMM